MNWVNVGINEISVYSAPKETVLDTADTNHMLGATMTASSNETATLTPDKAIDQNRTGRKNCPGQRLRDPEQHLAEGGIPAAHRGQGHPHLFLRA